MFGGFGEIRTPALWFAGRICVGIRNELYSGTRHQRTEHFGQISHRNLVFGIPDIVGLAWFPFQQRLEEAGNRIADVAEGSGLPSVAVNWQWTAIECLIRKHRYHPAIVILHARTKYVERPYD